MHSIGFRRSSAIGGIAEMPQRKVTFPESAPVSRFVEKTALRYRLKGTKYIFELARYDEDSRSGIEKFRQQGSVVYTGPMSDTPSTSWGASVFHPDWDNLLGDNANLPVGRSAQWSPQLDTFFPPKGTAVADDSHVGFWEFIRLMREVADLLSPAQTSLRQSSPSDTATETGASSVKRETASSQASSKESAATTQGKRSSKRLLDGDLGTLF